MLRASLVSIALSTGLMALTTSFPAWMVLRFITGLSSATAFLCASGIVLGVLNRRGRLDLSGWLYSGVGTGIAATGLVILGLQALPENIVADFADWRADWVGSALVAAILVVVCWIWLPNDEGSAADSSYEPILTSSKGLWLVIGVLSIAYFLEGLGYIVSGTFLVKIVDGMPGLGSFGTITWIFVGLSAVPSTVLWTKLAPRVGYVAALVSAYIAQALGIGVLSLSGSLWAAVASAILFGGTFMGITAMTVTFGRGLAPEQAVRIIGTLTAAYGLGQIIGPVMAATLTGGTDDFGPSLIAASAAVLLGGLLMLAVA